MELRVAVVVGGARPGHELRCMVFPGGSEMGPFETSADQCAVGRLHWSRTVTPEGDVFRREVTYVPMSGAFGVRWWLRVEPAHPAPVRARQGHRLSVTCQDEGTIITLPHSQSSTDPRKHP
jgi:hypothetical protein